jgi:hypothetical protein
LSYWLKIAPIGDKAKNFIEKRSRLFGLSISLNVGNHLIVGRIE